MIEDQHTSAVGTLPEMERLGREKRWADEAIAQRALYTEVMNNRDLQAQDPALYAEAINYFKHGPAPAGTEWSQGYANEFGPPTQEAQQIESESPGKGQQVRLAEVLSTPRLADSTEEYNSALGWLKGRPPEAHATQDPAGQDMSNLPMGGWHRYMEIIKNPKLADSMDELKQALAWAEERNIEVPGFDIVTSPGRINTTGEPVPPPPQARASEGDYLRQAAVHAEAQAGAKKELARKKAEEETGYYSTQIKAYEAYSNARGNLKKSLVGDMDVLRREARYPGITGGSDEIERLEQDVKRGKMVYNDPVLYGRRLSQEEMEEIIATGAAAKVRLSRGREVDQFRAFGSFGSKIMAIAAMGGSAMGSGDNMAFKMIMKTIDRDVEIQKDAFKAARGAPGERMGEYEKALSILKDERAVDLYLSSMRWGQASTMIKAQAESLGNYATADKLRAQAAKADEESARLQAEAVEESTKAIQAQELKERDTVVKERTAGVRERTAGVREQKETRLDREGKKKLDQGDEKLDLGWANLDEKTRYHKASLGLRRELGILDADYKKDLIALRGRNTDLSYLQFDQSKAKAALDEKYRNKAFKLEQEKEERKGDEFETTEDRKRDELGLKRKLGLLNAEYKERMADARERRSDLDDEQFEASQDKAELDEEFRNKQHGLELSKEDRRKDEFKVTEDRKQDELALRRELGELNAEYKSEMANARERRSDLNDEQFEASQDKAELDEEFRNKEFALRELKEESRADEFGRTEDRQDRALESSTEKWQAQDQLGRDRLKQDAYEHATMSAVDVARMAHKQGLLDEKLAARIEKQGNRAILTEKESQQIEIVRKKLAFNIREFEEVSAAQELQQENLVIQMMAKAKREGVKRHFDERSLELRNKKQRYLDQSLQLKMKTKDREFAWKEQKWNYNRAVEEKGVHIPGWRFVGDQKMASARTANVTETVRKYVTIANQMMAALEEGIRFSEEEGVTLMPKDKRRRDQVKGEIMNLIRQNEGFGVIAHLFEMKRLQALAGSLGEIWGEGTGGVQAGLQKRLDVARERMDTWMRDYGYEHDFGGDGPDVTIPEPESTQSAPSGEDDVFEIG